MLRLRNGFGDDPLTHRFEGISIAPPYCAISPALPQILRFRSFCGIGQKLRVILRYGFHLGFGLCILTVVNIHGSYHEFGRKRV